eukprot:1305010-Alexandrium_andersonii.AAC.1
MGLPARPSVSRLRSAMPRSLRTVKAGTTVAIRRPLRVAVAPAAQFLVWWRRGSMTSTLRRPPLGSM